MLKLKDILGKPIPRCVAKVIVIVGGSFLVSTCILFLARFCVFTADSLNLPVKWVVLILSSLVLTLIVGPLKEVV